MAYSPNYGFILEQIAREAGPRARVLDFGCGAGELVELGRSRGLAMVGADIFQTEDDRRATLGATGKLNTVVFEMPEGQLPFAEGSFEAVCSNMVFEHVEDLDNALAEIGRVLVPGGVLLSMMPTRETLREDHCGIALVHRLQSMPRAQYAYLLAARCLGFGHLKAGRGRRAWARNFRDYLQDFTFYRSEKDLVELQRAHVGAVERREADLAAYRLGRSRLGLASWLASRAVVRWGNAVLLSRKPGAATGC